MPATATPTASRTADEIRAEIAALEAELRKQEEAERKAAMAGNAKRAVALLSAMRQCMKELEELFPGTFDDEKFAALHTSQAWPRDTKFRRAADLSETEVHAAREAGKKAVVSIK